MYVPVSGGGPSFVQCPGLAVECPFIDTWFMHTCMHTHTHSMYMITGRTLLAWMFVCYACESPVRLVPSNLLHMAV